MGYAMSMALGKRVSPLPGCMEDREPLAPLYQCLQTFPLFSGDLGGPCLLPPFCLLFSMLPCFSAAKLGVIAPALLWG